MPTVFTHALVGAGLAAIAGDIQSPLVVGLSITLAALPDVDVLGLYFGVPYGSFFGHRGFSHSLCCALLVGLAASLATCSVFSAPWWSMWCYFSVVMASHGLLDGFTDGGKGIAFFSPFDTRRYYFPWRPIQVSYIGFSAFRHGLLRVLGSEVRWVWLPLAAVIGIRWLWAQRIG